ncbi:MAG: hypothetical protein KME31_24970 [Tolypothrix carrinoi HA7290-LM1]|jgi:hypothetical protein|nr:hypothetical protein [Tolypothrix carrinoi HA7290-LM1]
MLTNNFRRFVLAFMVTAAVVLSLTMLKPTVTAQTSINLAQKAKAEVSRTIGMPVDNLL